MSIPADLPTAIWMAPGVLFLASPEKGKTRILSYNPHIISLPLEGALPTNKAFYHRDSVWLISSEKLQTITVRDGIPQYKTIEHKEGPLFTMGACHRYIVNANSCSLKIIEGDVTTKLNTKHKHSITNFVCNLLSKVVLSTDRSGSVIMTDVTKKESQILTVSSAFKPSLIAISSNGKLGASVNKSSLGYKVWVYNLEDNTKHELFETIEQVTCIAVTSLSLYIGTVSGQVIKSSLDGKDVTRTQVSDEMITAMAAVPDGQSEQGVWARDAADSQFYHLY